MHPQGPGPISLPLSLSTPICLLFQLSLVPSAQDTFDIVGVSLIEMGYWRKSRNCIHTCSWKVECTLTFSPVHVMSRQHENALQCNEQIWFYDSSAPRFQIFNVSKCGGLTVSPGLHVQHNIIHIDKQGFFHLLLLCSGVKKISFASL